MTCGITKRSCLIISLTLFVAGVSTAHALTVKVGVFCQPPLVSAGTSVAAPRGLCIDVLDAIAVQKGWQLSYITDSRANIMAKLARKEIDLMVPAPLPLDGAENLDYTTSAVLSSQGQIFVPDQTSVTSLQDLSGKLIAFLKDDVHYLRFLDVLRQTRIKCQFIEMRSYDDILQAVAAGRADAGLIDRFYGSEAGRAYGLTPSHAMSAPVDFHMAVARDSNRQLLLNLEQGLAALKQDRKSGYYQAVSRWTASPESSNVLMWALVVLLLSVSVAGIIVIWRIRGGARTHSDKLISANRQLLKTVDDHLRREAAADNLKVWYRTLLNNTPDSILIHGVDAKGMPGKFVEANETACTRLGYSREELLSLSIRDIEINPDGGAAPRYAKLLIGWREARMLEPKNSQGSPSSLTCELSLRTKSGSEIPVEVIIHILEHEGQPVVFYSSHDITSRRQAQRALKESERRFADFFVRSPIGVALYDPSRQLTDVNHAALAMFGFSERSQFVATHLLESNDLSPESQATLLKGGTVRYEATIDFDEAKREKRYQSARAGKSHFDVLITNLGLDSEFKPKGYMMQIQDVSDQRRAEDALRQHERLLRQAQKMEAIGTLAGGIAHDFNNLLTPIIGYTEMALVTSKPNDPIRPNLDEVLKASHRAKDLVKQILTFSRQTEYEVKPLRLTPLVKEVVQLLRGSVLPIVDLKLNLQAERDIVRADPTQMHQVLMNLCTNALHAMKEKGGVLEVGMRQTLVDSRTRGALSRLRYGPYVELYVRDTGHGMDRSVLDRIFEPFFTTKRTDEGTGMGLAVVHGIITSLRGTITVESEIGKGTTFHTFFPLAESTAETTPADQDPLPQGTEKILFVDDEAGIVTMVSQMLTSLGYKVVTCARAAEALTVFRADPDRFDAIVTDQIMPGMNGMDMVHEMHMIRPGIPALLCTGFSKTVSDRELLREGVHEILMKPIVLRQLAESVRRTLDSAKSKIKVR